jgi:FkbM family methyltransferase
MNEIEYLGKTITITDKSVGYYGSFLNGRPFEEDLIIRFLNDTPKNGIVLDIGACTGSYAMLDLIRADIQIHSFEPSRAFKELAINVKTNGSATECYNMAVSNQSGIFDFNEIEADGSIALSMLGGKPAAHKEYKSIQIDVITIDDLAMIPDIIKIDTEGAELMVLQGGVETITKHHPIIYCEYSDENTTQYGYAPHQIVDLLELWGYTIEITGSDLIAKWEN